MRSTHSLSLGLIISLIIAATVFGALVLSVQQPSNLLAELPIPTATLDLSPAPPTVSSTPQQPEATTSVSLAPTGTPSPTPTACPVPADWQLYVVGPFDTLALLAQRFNLTLDQLARANCLTQFSVTVGQSIVVPAFRPTPTAVQCYPPYNWAVYIVQPGDTLSGIALRYGMSVYTLMRANCLTSSNLYPGQRLFVPPLYPIATFTPIPISPTFTPTPIASLTPTGTPVEITLTPSDTPTPTSTLVPSETPTATPIATDTPVPTNTPAPTDTPPPSILPTP